MTSSRRITVQDVARLGYHAPVQVQWSPDGRFVTYLYSPERSLRLELWAFDPDTGREWPVAGLPAEETVPLTREEELRRERQRQFATGVASHAWSETGNTLLIRAGGTVFVQDGLAGRPRPVGGAECLDPQLNRDGTHLAFVRDGELHVLDLTADAAPRRLTFDAAPPDEYGDRAITNGLAEFVAQEEMHRHSGFWWSPDGARLAFEQVDHRPVSRFFIAHPGTDDVQVEVHRYPFAGKDNVRWRLGVVPVAGGAVCWLREGGNESYLARVHWTPDGRILAQVQSRDQRRAEVRRLDPDTGQDELLWVEETEPWVNLHDDLRFVRRRDAPPEEYAILWSSERTGRRALYLYGRDGTLLRALTDGTVCVDEVRAVDAEGGWVYFEGWDESPLERHLFRVPLAGGAIERLTATPGTHRCVLSPDCRRYVDVASAVDEPTTATVREVGGRELGRLQAAAPPGPRQGEVGLVPPQFIVVRAEDGTTLYGAVYRPREVPAGAKVPVIVDVYGGPHVQQVANHWGVTADLRNQYLAQQGYVVLVLDNRGSARRGLAFEAPISGNLGDREVQDQVAGVRALAKLVPEADLERVGVCGWSYGGYLALMCLARAPEVFKAAVAGAPVTSWDGYDTHYTERYMGTPQENPDGYRQSAVMTHVERIRGRLLLIHGMIDENVHFRHSGRLVNALIRAGVPFETLFFPEERHAPRREEDRVFLERLIADFFARHL